MLVVAAWDQVLLRRDAGVVVGGGRVNPVSLVIRCWFSGQVLLAWLSEFRDLHHLCALLIQVRFVTSWFVLSWCVARDPEWSDQFLRAS